MDGQYLSYYKADRPSNAVIEVLDQFMDFDNHKVVKEAFENRLFGITVCWDPSKLNLIVTWMGQNHPQLANRVIFKGMLQVIRKMIYRADECEEEIKVRGTTFRTEYGNLDKLGEKMGIYMDHLETKSAAYYHTKESNRKQKWRREGREEAEKEFANNKRLNRNKVCVNLRFCGTKNT